VGYRLSRLQAEGVEAVAHRRGWAAPIAAILGDDHGGDRGGESGSGGRGRGRGGGDQNRSETTTPSGAVSVKDLQERISATPDAFAQVIGPAGNVVATSSGLLGRPGTGRR
jgi:hypothetical protein